MSDIALIVVGALLGIGLYLAFVVLLGKCIKGPETPPSLPDSAAYKRDV